MNGAQLLIPFSDASGSDSSSETVSFPLTLDLPSPNGDDDMTTVSSATSDLGSPSSPLVYFSPKSVSQVIRLPHMTSGFVWSDGTIRDVEVQTDPASKVHQSCQTDYNSIIEIFAERMVSKILMKSFLSMFLPTYRRQIWESTEELTEPLSYDSGIEEFSRTTSECPTLTKGGTQEKASLSTIGEDQFSEGLQELLDRKLSETVLENCNGNEKRNEPITSSPFITEKSNERLELKPEGLGKIPLEAHLDKDSLTNLIREENIPRTLFTHKSVDNLQELEDYLISLPTSSDSEVNFSDAPLPDVVDVESNVKVLIPRKERKKAKGLKNGSTGLSITDVTHIADLTDSDCKIPLVDLPSDTSHKLPKSVQVRKTFMTFEEVTMSDFDLPLKTKTWPRESASVLESETDHLRRVEEEIIRSLQQRCAPTTTCELIEPEKIEAVDKWLNSCGPQRNGHLSPVPEETEEESCSSEGRGLSLVGLLQKDDTKTSTGASQSSRESSILGEIGSRTTTDNSVDDSESVTSSVGDDQERPSCGQRVKHRTKKPDPFVDELKERLRLRREKMVPDDCWEVKKGINGDWSAENEVWSPAVQSQNQQQPSSPQNEGYRPGLSKDDPSSASPSENKENMSPVWQPFGGGPDDKPQFRSVQPTSPATQRKDPFAFVNSSKPLVCSDNSSQQTTSPISSQGKPLGPLSPGGSSRIGVSSGLFQYQNPTITLLQKAREGQLPKGAIYIDQQNKDDIPSDAILVEQRVTVEGDQVHTDSYYALPRQELISTGNTRVIKAPAKIEGIGPTERGIPVTLRSGVKEEYASDWYKSMFKSLHTFDKPDNDYMSVKYGKKAGRVPHSGGYMSEPEFERDDGYPYSSRYATLDYRRRPPPEKISYVERHPLQSKDPRSSSFQPSHICPEVYRNQPRSIAEYEPGRSSIAEREARLEEPGDDGNQHPSKYLPPLDHPRATYIDGYESDSTLIRKTGSKPRPLDPQQQKAWYREVQRGGDIPFSGLGKPAPERPKLAPVGPPPPPPLLNYTEDELLASLARDQVSPHRYQEGEVNIHYRTPVRNLEKEFIEEETLRKRQEAAMRKFYEEERYKKQLQHMHEIEMRRHSDNFTPSQKSPIPLNRYDNPFELPRTPPKTPEPRSLAKALFNFKAQSSRELSLNKGDIVYVTKKVDRNWYEGEHHGLFGIFPVSYVEIIPAESANLQPRKPTEGQARAKYSFRAQTPVELSLFKGELVILTRRVDQNWYEGRIGTKKGIFPAAYVEVMTEPDSGPLHSKKSPKLNGTHSVRLPYRSLREAFSSYPATSQSTSRSDTTSMSSQDDKKQPITETLHVDTYSEPIPYRALYSYRPQNDDELELKDGDTVYVMEKCDDGWYVGTSLRTGLFGTFPGNYVERI